MNAPAATRQPPAADPVPRPAATFGYAVQPTARCAHVVVIRDNEHDWWRCSSCGQTEQCHDTGDGPDCEGGPRTGSDGNRRCSVHDALRAMTAGTATPHPAGIPEHSRPRRPRHGRDAASRPRRGAAHIEDPDG